MELIYLWIEEFRNIKEQGFSFSPRYNVLIENNTIGRRLKIEKTDYDTQIFDKNITNITALVGKNGSGKTNILDILGMRMDERRKLRDARYFMLYHHKNHIFSIEGNDFLLIKNNVLGFPSNAVKEPYSMLLEQNGEFFVFKGFLQFEDIEHKKLRYFNFRNRFSNEYNKLSFKIDTDYTTYFNRFNINPVFIGSYSKYRD
ncbi:MAG: hypothetical protein KGZ79_08940 [Dethiobacter sp.]|jgi:AAA15 family ATPase/GTPase|nr:hypothetical protein [Dethiobacter sp.]